MKLAVFLLAVPASAASSTQESPCIFKYFCEETYKGCQECVDNCKQYLCEAESGGGGLRGAEDLASSRSGEIVALTDAVFQISDFCPCLNSTYETF